MRLTIIFAAEMNFLFIILLAHLVAASKVSVVEEQPEGTFVANVRDHLPKNLSSKSDLKFGFLRGYDKKGLFQIDESTGVITTAMKLDRESLCPREENCVFDVISLCYFTLNQFHIIPIKVEVLDINDNNPTFGQQKELLMEISESEPVSAKFKLPAASDADKGKNSEIEYSLPAKSAKDIPFVIINAVNGETQDVYLQLTAPLDREKKDFYSFSLVANDKGVPSLSGSIDLVIQVLDSNDHAPVFDAESYEVRVQENVPRGTKILRCTATDADLGRNAEVTYSIASSTSKLARDIFEIDSETGELYLKSDLDREIKDVHKVYITAKDRATNPLETTVLATIFVDDLNDNPPLISYFTTEANAAYIAEDAPIGTFVALVKLQDADSGNNARAVCSLNSDTFDLQMQSEDTYAIITKSLLDREKREEYLLELTARDHGKPSLESRTAIQIVLKDVNDNGPVFDRSAYAVKVKENTAIGTEILQLKVTDKDSAPENQKVKFRMEPSALFGLDEQRGVLFIRSQLDRETLGDVMQFTVEAFDPTQSGLPASLVPVIVEILDENDNAPIFSSSAFELEIASDLKKGVVVGTVFASDSDFGNNGQVTYHLNSSEFLVNRTSGDVITAKDIFVNDARQIQLTLVARDAGEPSPRSSSAQLLITIANATANQLANYGHSPLTFFLSSTGLPVIIALIAVSFLLLGVGIVSVICYRNKSKDQNVYNVRMETARVFQKTQLGSQGENGLGAQGSDSDSCHRHSAESDEKYASWVFSSNSQTPPVSSSTKSSRCSSANTNRNSVTDYGKASGGQLMFDVVNEEPVSLTASPGKSIQTFQLANQLQKKLDDAHNGAVSDDDDDGGFLKTQRAVSVTRAGSLRLSHCARNPLILSAPPQYPRPMSSANGLASSRFVTLPRRDSVRSSSGSPQAQQHSPFALDSTKSGNMMVITPLTQSTRSYIEALQVQAPSPNRPTGSVDSGAETGINLDSPFSSSLNMSCKSFGTGLEYDDFLPQNGSPMKPGLQSVCHITEYQSIC